MNHLKDIENKKSTTGFTLLEVIVSLGIFMAVITVGMSAVLILFDSSKRSQDLKSVMNNLSVAVDSMAREIVVGTNYICASPVGDQMLGPKDCPVVGGSEITFCSSENQPMAYRFNDDAERIVERRIGEISSGECEGGSSIVWGDWIRIISTEVEITRMDFYVSGAETPCEQPRVLVKIDGEAGTETRKSDFEIQTTVSQRVPDLSILENIETICN